MTLSQEQQKSEREEFEAHVRKHHRFWTLHREESGDYSSMSVFGAWEGWKAGRASMLRPIPEVEGWRLVPLDLDAFAEVCHNAHIDYALDKFPSYERAIEHHYITLLNALRDQSPPSNVEPA